MEIFQNLTGTLIPGCPKWMQKTCGKKRVMQEAIGYDTNCKFTNRWLMVVNTFG